MSTDNENNKFTIYVHNLSFRVSQIWILHLLDRFRWYLWGIEKGYGVLDFFKNENRTFRLFVCHKIFKIFDNDFSVFHDLIET